MPMPITHVTKESFQLAADLELDPTFCTNDGPLGFGCVVSADAYNRVKEYLNDIDPDFSTRKPACPQFNIVSGTDRRHEGYSEGRHTGQHYLTYSYGGKRMSVYLTPEQHKALRPYTEAFDLLTAGELSREEYLEVLAGMPQLDLKLYANPETDWVYNDNALRMQQKRDDKKSAPAVAPTVDQQEIVFCNPSGTEPQLTSVAEAFVAEDEVTEPSVAEVSSKTEAKRETDAAYSQRGRRRGTVRNEQGAELAEKIKLARRAAK